MIVAALLAATVAAAPPAGSFKRRGVLEGFYGRPWTWAQRKRLVDWLPAHHFNLYAIAPKDDPELRERWREPLSTSTLANLEELARRAAKRGVTLAWTLSPGLDARYDDPSDAAAAADKLQSVCALGITSFSLAFDDTRPDARQPVFVGKVYDRLLERCPKAGLTFVPAVYWSDAAPSAYLDAVARRLDPRIVVGWTGARILNRRIEAAEADRFRRYIRHELVLGDNYPVQDRVVDAGRLFLGPLTGRDASLPRFNEAYLANASPLFEASLIPLATAGDYAWDPPRYDAKASWRRALESARGGAPEAALEVFAGLCSRSWLEPPGGDETDRLERVLARYWLTGDSRVLRAMLREISAASKALAALPAPLRRELSPWLAAASKDANAALAALDGKPGAPRAGAAVLADQALDRLMSRARFRDPAGSEPLARSIRRHLAGGGSPAALRVGLERLASLEDGGELSPWEWLLPREAAAARDALDGRPWTAWRLAALRWRARLRFVPLLVSRDLMEDFIRRREAAWGLPVRPARLDRAERLWLFCSKLFRPRSFEARLSRALSAFERKGDAAPLRAALAELSAAAPERPLVVEDVPWLSKLADYAETGTLSLEPLEPEGWALRRERLASGNGLELAVELQLALDALARGRKGDVSFPSDPAAAL